MTHRGLNELIYSRKVTHVARWYKSSKMMLIHKPLRQGAILYWRYQRTNYEELYGTWGILHQKFPGGFIQHNLPEEEPDVLWDQEKRERITIEQLINQE